jgi:hypothetical protein
MCTSVPVSGTLLRVDRARFMTSFVGRHVIQKLSNPSLSRHPIIGGEHFWLEKLLAYLRTPAPSLPTVTTHCPSSKAPTSPRSDSNKRQAWATCDRISRVAELRLHITTNKQPRQHRFAGPTMRWPWSGDEDDEKNTSFSARAAKLKSQDWASAATDPATIGTSLALTACTVAFLRFYKSYLRRIPTVNHIKPDYFRRRSLFGQVTSVGDADNFRLFHTPGGRIAGWGWLPWKKVPTTREGLAKNTVSFAQCL